MKVCNKCGKELPNGAAVCPTCGAAVQTVPAESAAYEACVGFSSTTNVISLVLIVLGLLVFLFVYMFGGAILCLAAEIVAFLPKWKLQAAFKKNGLNKSAEGKQQMKAITKALKAKNSAFNLSNVLAIIALVLLLAFVGFEQAVVSSL